MGTTGLMGANHDQLTRFGDGTVNFRWCYNKLYLTHSSTLSITLALVTRGVHKPPRLRLRGSFVKDHIPNTPGTISLIVGQKDIHLEKVWDVHTSSVLGRGG